ncbi:hypothetical protein AVEN_248676-1 [Araneus ventricosus]|uniref:Uncharacterized protein n=1 Tax=Araneus ventricosus TaxID=182803 RepID=A0A4Y2C1V8_ARAVE|nr:hypothetical protein AVEN_248676-1 [Araneus ventricosus]
MHVFMTFVTQNYVAYRSSCLTCNQQIKADGPGISIIRKLLRPGPPSLTHTSTIFSPFPLRNKLLLSRFRVSPPFCYRYDSRLFEKYYSFGKEKVNEEFSVQNGDGIDCVLWTQVQVWPIYCLDEE